MGLPLSTSLFFWSGSFQLIWFSTVQILSVSTDSHRPLPTGLNGGETAIYWGLLAPKSQLSPMRAEEVSSGGCMKFSCKNKVEVGGQTC